MKTLGGATLAGVLVALLLIYWLSPLNGGAVALVLLLCVSAANLVVGAVVAARKRAETPGKPARKKKRGRGPRMLILALLLAGYACAKPPTSESLPPKPKHNATAARPREAVPARDILLRGHDATAGYGAYGYVVLTKRPGSETLRRRYLAICQEYEDSLEPTTEHPEVPPSQLMVTFWLASSETAPQRCEDLVASYDFGRASEIAAAIHMQGAQGPILVAWAQPFRFGAPNAGDALVVDMSKFSSEDDISQAFGIWKDRICQNPEVWSHGFNLALVRLELQSFLNTYGQQVVALIGGGGSH